jgi:hypothetical protein
MWNACHAWAVKAGTRDSATGPMRHRVLGRLFVSLAAVVLIAMLDPVGSLAGPTDAANPTPASGGRGCAARVSGQPKVRAAGHASVLVPTRGIAGARLCRYFGLNHAPGAGPAFTLASSTHLARREALRLARRFDGLAPVVGGPRHCPADLGGRLFVRFGYPDRPPVLVKVFLGGCIEAVSEQAGPAFEVLRGFREQLEELAPN